MSEDDHLADGRDDPAGTVAADEERRDPPIEPGTPSLENAVFVLLGVLIALAVVGRLVMLFG